jgi:hypothetical protein
MNAGPPAFPDQARRVQEARLGVGDELDRSLGPQPSEMLEQPCLDPIRLDHRVGELDRR